MIYFYDIVLILIHKYLNAYFFWLTFVDFLLCVANKDLDELGASSSSVFWKESPDTKLKDEYRSDPMLQGNIYR